MGTACRSGYAFACHTSSLMVATQEALYTPFSIAQGVHLVNLLFGTLPLKVVHASVLHAWCYMPKHASDFPMGSGDIV